GTAFDTVGLYPELNAAFDSFDPHALDGTPWHDAYRRVAPDPDAWPSLVTKVNDLDRAGMTISPAQLSNLQVPTQLIIGDADIVRPEHTVEMFRPSVAACPATSSNCPQRSWPSCRAPPMSVCSTASTGCRR